MARVTKSGLLIFLLLCPSFAQHKKAALQLSINILNQRYCKDKYSNSITLRLKLEMAYTNTGDIPIILQKGGNLVTDAQIARDQEALSQGKYEMQYSVLWDVSGNVDALDVNSLPNPRFAIVKPGATYKTSGETRINVDRLTAGEHMLRVGVSTWQGSQKRAEELRRRWSKTGCFWFGETVSEPMLFTVKTKKN